MDPQSIILIVGVAVLIMERLFSCLNRVRTSKCCGGEIDLSPEKNSPKNSLNVSKENTLHEIEKKIEVALQANEVINNLVQKRSRSPTPISHVPKE